MHKEQLQTSQATQRRTKINMQDTEVSFHKLMYELMYCGNQHICGLMMTTLRRTCPVAVELPLSGEVCVDLVISWLRLGTMNVYVNDHKPSNSAISLITTL